MEAFLGGHLEPFRKCLFRTRSSSLCSHTSRAHRIGSSSMTFSLYSAQLFRYDGAFSLNSTRERPCLRMTGSRTHWTLKMMLWAVMVRRSSQKTFVWLIRRVSHFPFLSVHKICLLYSAMQFIFCTMSGGKLLLFVMVLPNMRSYFGLAAFRFGFHQVVQV